MTPKTWVKEHESEIKAFAIRNAVTIASHPFEYAKVLMQLGYEPYPPTEATSLIFRTKYLALPNVLSYLKYMKSVDGFFGCFRGLLPRLCESNAYYFTYTKCSEYCPLDRTVDDVKVFAKALSWDCVSVTVGTTISYPIHVIVVRSMAQFVGRECKYDSLFGSIADIYKSDGLFGFFKGLFPRLISEILNVVIAGTCVFLVTKYITKENPQITNLAGGFVANSFSYQFHLVSKNMAANTCSLLLGNPPHAYKHYPSWYDCWVTLRREGQIGRGSSMIARHFTGPAIRTGDRIAPLNYTFGPIHPPGLGGSCYESIRVMLKECSANLKIQ